MAADWGPNHYTPGPPGPEMALVFATGILALGWVLAVTIGPWWTLAWVGCVLVAGVGLYLLLHRLRSGRWAP